MNTYLKRSLLSICLIAWMGITANAQAQESLNQTWQLTSGWMDQGELHFERIADPSAYKEWAQAFTFQDDGTILYQFLMPDGRGICGNGLLYIETATYKTNKRNTKMRLFLKGGHMMDDTFEYEVKYKILRFTETELVLKARKVKKAEVNSSFGLPSVG